MFLPVNRDDMALRDWYYLDFLLISGDAYVDHYSFANAIVGRWLEHLGYRVGIIPQPDVTDPESLKIMGKPRYGVLISAGNMDSMINHYTAAKKVRSRDLYSPGGKRGMRPDYATAVYARLAKQVFPDIPVIIGGVEAGLRRFAHYDFWQDKVLPSMLISSGADLLVYGMGELPLKEIAEKLAAGEGVGGCRRIAGVCWKTDKPPVKRVMEIPTLRQVSRSKRAFAQAFNYIDNENNFYDGRPVVQRHDDIYLVANPPSRPLITAEMDEIYDMPFENRWHPMYDELGGVPAFDEVRFSLLSHRGCFGGCSFCSINFHQGKVIQNRSERSLLAEAKRLTEQPDFKGYIHDVGGPTANFRGQGCDKAKKRGNCRNKQCLYPEPCQNLRPHMREYVQLLDKLEKLPNVKKVFIRSGIRYDYVMADRRDDFFRHLVEHNVSGLLKVAPEHCSENVLAAMEKPSYRVYRGFQDKFNRITKQLGKKQYVLPYFIAAHPGSTLHDAIDLAMVMKNSGLRPEQVQLFIPTPGSRSTCMYYTGLNPRTMKPIYVARTETERDMQRALLQYGDKKNWGKVRAALKKAGREELIGWGQGFLVPPAKDFNNNGRNDNRKGDNVKTKGHGQQVRNRSAADRGAKNRSVKAGAGRSSRGGKPGGNGAKRRSR